ncbi:DUF677 domain-containing protein [Halorarius halobius]|uniref:DUF677 domain-containing protein n=1 Tax=Halorarius halobius TaxID=2962671 RepID=UPI0020CFAE1C|nr:DUF677 domain-containing protein [Halorarius halobius]
MPTDATSHALYGVAAVTLGSVLAVGMGNPPATAVAYGLLAGVGYVAWDRALARYHTGSWAGTVDEVER